MQTVIIKTQLTKEDFIRVNFALLFQRTATKLLLVLALVMIILPVLIAINSKTHYSWKQSIIGVIMLFLYVIPTYFFARKSYNTNPAIRQALTYEFTKGSLSASSGDASSQTTWDKIYRVSETKSSLIFWRNKQVATVLPKRDITAQQLAAIKTIVQQNKVKNNLK